MTKRIVRAAAVVVVAGRAVGLLHLLGSLVASSYADAKTGAPKWKRR